MTTFFIWCIKDTVIKQNANVNKDYDMFNIFVGFIQHASIDTAHDLLSKWSCVSRVLFDKEGGNQTLGPFQQVLTISKSGAKVIGHTCT